MNERNRAPYSGDKTAEIVSRYDSAETQKAIEKRRSIFQRAFGRLPDDIHVFNVTNSDGGFIAQTKDGNFVGLRIVAVNDASGHNVQSWRVVNVVGDTTIPVGQQYRAKLGDMPEDLRRGLRLTLEAKRALGETDTYLAQANQLREQGREYGRSLGADTSWTEDPRAMQVGGGYILWEQLPDGKLKVKKVTNVNKVKEGTVYTVGLKNAPHEIKTAAKASGTFILRDGEIVELAPSPTSASTESEPANIAAAA